MTTATHTPYVVSLADLRSELLDQIDGAEECREHDSRISRWIASVDCAKVDLAFYQGAAEGSARIADRMEAVLRRAQSDLAHFQEHDEWPAGTCAADIYDDVSALLAEIEKGQA